MKYAALIFCTVIPLFLSGCASPVQEKTYEPPPLMIGQNSDGDVNLEWNSKAGCLYTVFYQLTPESEWVGLNGAVRVPGNGETLTAYHKINPYKPAPRYRILEEEIP